MTPGTKLSHYQILARIGAGGMGAVYRARDTKLGREVAVKVLPDSLASEPERIARFEREARLLAALNHPGIATLHGFEEAEGVRFLVMELIEGEPLSERAARGPLSIDEAVPLFRRIAEALEAAHERGIVHRDLKPENVKITPDGRPKVLDFGLAKIFGPEPVEESGPESPTVTREGTEAGAILGTVAYMSPEQVRGGPLDKRTDIWSFGCVLYELLTGRQAFAGDTPSDTIAAILGSEPDWKALPARTPESVRRLLRRCLQKEPGNRLRDIGDACIELDTAAAEPLPAARPKAHPPSPRTWAWRFASAVAVAFALWGWLRPDASSPRGPVRMTASLPSGVRLTRGPGFASSVALSPDGRTLVIAGTSEDGRRLYRRPLDRLEASPLPGTEGGSSPFFSPDGAWIGFHAEGQLKRVPATGGTAVDVAAVPSYLAGASWGPDDRIAFVSGARSPVWVVEARGGASEPVTEVSSSKIGHFRPELLPDGDTLLFDSGGWIHALDLESGRRSELVEGFAPGYATTGHVILSRERALLATRFDPARLELTGPVVPLVEGVAGELFTAGGGTRHYALSRSGTLAYVPATTAHALVLTAPDGAERLATEERRAFENPQFSPDGERLAVASARRSGEPTDLWIHELDAGTASRLTFEGGRAPVWTPDGGSVTYSHLGERQGIYTKPADGRGEAEQLVSLDAAHWLVGWSPDGRTLAYGALEESSEETRSFSSVFALTGGESRRVVGPGPIWGGRLSPDGRWLAYYSLESGRFEVYVTPFPAGDTRWQISEDGGRDPTWAPSGEEIYYRSADRLMAARIHAGAGVRVLSRRLAHEPFTPPLYDDYDIHPDDGTLVWVRPVGDAQGADVTIVLDWFEELRELTSQ